MSAFFAGKRYVYDVVSMIHSVIRTANSCPYTDKLMFIGVRHNKTQHIRR